MAYDKVVDSAKLEAGLTSIADAIRNYADTAGPPRARQFPEGFVQGVTDVYNTAVDAAQQDIHDAYMQGLEEGRAAGISEGKQAFWDSAQKNGTRTDYTTAFAGRVWNDDIYDPEYPITATDSSSYLFWNSYITDTKVPIDIGDTSNSGSSRFNNAIKLVTIRKLIVGENATFASCFTGCTSLVNLTIEGVIGNSLTLSPCTKLTHDSLMSVINHLKDYAGSGTTHTLTLGTTNLNKLTADEKKIATDKGWTLA